VAGHSKIEQCILSERKSAYALNEQGQVTCVIAFRQTSALDMPVAIPITFS